MSHLSISLFGGIEVILDGKPIIAFGTNKAKGLLAFLAVNSARPCPRTELGTILWPDLPEKKAAHNLSQTLLRLRQALQEGSPTPQSFLLSTSQDIRFNPESDYQIDVTRFTELLRMCHQHKHPNAETCHVCIDWLHQAVNLYRGNFLAGFFMQESANFEDWRLILQETLHRQVMEALAQLSAYYEQFGDYERARGYAQRQVTLDPWDEQAHLQLIRMLAQCGQPAAALKQYKVYRRAMIQELGITPSAEATLLYKQIQAGGLPKQKTGMASIHKTEEPVWLPKGGERRQVTALVCGRADAVVLNDPEELQQRLTSCKQHCERILNRFGGYRMQRQGTDCLIYFGYPQAYEDAPRRAVHAGLAITATLKTGNPIRIGIHSGVMMVDEQQGGGWQSRELVGNVPDLARTCQNIAEPFMVLITKNTRYLVQDWFDYQAFKPSTSANQSCPIDVYQVFGRSMESRFNRLVQVQHLTSLIGREYEIEQLLAYQTRVLQGRGQVILLTGEPGIGKSRLVWELKRKLFLEVDKQPAKTSALLSPAIQFQPVLWLENHCLPYFQNTGLHPLTGLLEQLLGFKPDDSLENKQDKLSDMLNRFNLAHPATTRLLSLLLELPTETPASQTITAEQHERMREIFVTLLRKQSVVTPIVLVIEDMHWSDPTTVEWLNRSFDSLATCACLMVLTSRPTFKPAWSPRTHIVTLNLERLNPTQTEWMVSCLAGEARLSQETRRRIAARTDGVPLFVEELTKTVLESTVVLSEVVESSNNLPEVPATLRDSLMARLDHLGEAKETACWAAVLGREFSYPVLLIATGFDEPRLQNDLIRLIEAELIFLLDKTPYTTYTFKHILIQEAAYTSLSKRTRRHYHRRIAETLETHFPRTAEIEPEILAQHYALAGSSVQAADYWLLAGERAVTLDATSEAKTFFDRALDLIKPTDYDRLWRALCGREIVLSLVGDRKAQEADLATLLTLAESLNNDTYRAEAYLRQTNYAGIQGNYRATIALAEASSAAACRAGNLTMELRALAYKAQTLIFFKELAEAQQVVEEILTKVNQIENGSTQAQIFTVAAHYYLEAGDLVRSAQLQSRSVETARQAGNHNLEILFNANLGLIYIHLGLYAQAQAILETGLIQAESVGDRRLYASSIRLLGYIHWLSGNGSMAQQMVEQALKELQTIGDVFGETVCLVYLGYISESAGDYNLAAEYLASAKTNFAKIGVKSDLFEAQAIEARVALIRGQKEKAQQLATEVWNYLTQYGTDGMDLPFQVYICITDVFNAVEMSDLALKVIETGYHKLMQNADKISNIEWRRTFLENVPGSRTIVDLYKKWFSQTN